jgi:hypothetical protein
METASSRGTQRRWIQRAEMKRKGEPTENILLGGSIYKQCIENTPLSTRAWVLQEHMLAQRTLHSSPTQMVWGYREHGTCESAPRLLVGINKRVDFELGL